MRQLSGLDAAFLNLETPSAPLHVASVLLADPAADDGPVGFDEIQRTVASRLSRLAPFRWRLAEVPLGIDHPYWVDDPGFDVEYHIRRIGVPLPADYGQLAELVARIHARPLDRSRPLWEMYVIEGLDTGELAVYTKMHHAAIDGVSGAEILTVLLDTDPVPPPMGVPDPPPGERVPSPSELWVRGTLNLARRPWRAAQTAVRTARALPYMGRMVGLALPAMSALAFGPDLLDRPRLQAPPTPFNTTITPHRRFAFGSLSLDRIKAVKNRHGVTVNDVVMAICAGALRSYLLDHDALPDQPLQAMVPLSVRTDEEKGAMGNRVTSMVSVLPTHLADPIARLEAAHAAMNVAKRHNAIPADLLRDYSQFVSPALAARAARAVARVRWADRIRTPVNVVISNVPGPGFPLYLAGARLRHLYPVSAIAESIGLNITLQSYRSQVDFGLVSCREVAPDLWRLMDHIHSGLEGLEAASQPKRRTSGRSSGGGSRGRQPPAG